MNPILLLHGALGAESQLQLLKQALVREGFVVYTLNFSGHGGVPFKESFGIETFAAGVVDFLDKNGLDQVDIFGYSMGGYVALWLALNHPHRVRKIITLGTKFDWSKESAETEIRKLNVEKILEKVPAFARILEQRHAPNSWRELLQKTSGMMRALGESPLLDSGNLSKIKNEVLILLGDADEMADRNFSEECSRIIPNSKFVLLPNTPHPIEKVGMKILLGEILNFLDSGFLE
jgi:pimeloyl-ACP methyl ester carboxylesterase